MEKMIIQDALSSPLSLDAITIYSCRPPELRFVNSPVLYFKYFTRLAHKPANSITKKTTCETLLHSDVRKSGWVDGLDCQILIKPTAIKLVMNMSSCTKGIQHICNILNYVLYGEIINESDVLETPMALLNYQRTFIDLNYGLYRELPFPLFNVVKPTQSNRFLIHILLSMGYFDNEGCLFQGQHMKDFFANAQLITSNQNPSEDDVVRIVKIFVLEQLLYIPGGTMMFDRYCIAAYDAIKYALLSDSIICNDVPSYLYTSLVAEANRATTTMLQDNKLSLAKSVCQLPSTPKLSELISATKENPLVWKPQMCRIKDQSEESFLETNKVCELTTESIDSYTSAQLSNTKSLLICGGPGTGKTFQMQLAAAYALSKGLTTIITAVMAERALYLGGRHLHYLFSIPADNTKNVHKIIDQCIRGLNNNPERLYLLRIADVILIDEMGYMSANLLNVIDTVLRKIRGKSSFMGGVLLIGTIDDQQIPPVRAIPLLVSSLIPTSFIMVLLIHSVRARGDTSLQLLINISRKIRPTPVDIQQFRSIIINECSHVSDWGDKRIQQGTMRILGTKKALLTAEREYYSNIEKQGLVIVTREAETSQCCIGSHGNWKTADFNISQSLNRFVNEVETLRLHENMIVEMTYNKVNTWSHCQIGILLDLPTTENLNAWKPIQIMLAPVGVNRLPEVAITKDTLTQHGWREIKVGTAPENEVRMYGKITAKRKQYAIKPRIAMTIHKALGGNFGSVATTVNFSNTNSGYRLWQKEQVEVLISRTPTTTDLIFVGDPTETADNLVELLFKISPFSVYMRHIVGRMTSTNSTNCVIEPLEYLPYNVISTVIPSESEYGYVYLLLSLRDHNTTYVGQTNNLKRRVSEHNRGIGSKVTTASALRPWYPIAFITGFDAEDEHERLQIESSWQQVRNRSGKSSQNIIDILHAGKNLVAAKNEYVYKYAKLKFIQCIKFN
jgi:predicted GIY-YIG superfamily endonuclease